MNITDKSLLEVLRKKAEGYKISEVSEEYTYSAEGEKTLTKQKITEKHIAPDLAALKLLMELSIDDEQDLTAEQLEQEKARLLDLLRKTEENSSNE